MPENTTKSPHRTFGRGHRGYRRSWCPRCTALPAHGHWEAAGMGGCVGGYGLWVFAYLTIAHDLTLIGFSIFSFFREAPILLHASALLPFCIHHTHCTFASPVYMRYPPYIHATSITPHDILRLYTITNTSAHIPNHQSTSSALCSLLYLSLPYVPIF